MNLNHTQLYNYILDASNYEKQQAPIEQAIDQIVKGNKPAVLLTDFEEYNNGKIQKAAYAKRGFIDWLAKGFNITFYKWDFEEKGKEKCMFIAIFDDNANRLNGAISRDVALLLYYCRLSFILPWLWSWPSVRQGTCWGISSAAGVGLKQIPPEKFR